MARQRKVKIIIAATAMFHDDTHLHTELPLPLNRCDANGKLSIVPEPVLKSAHEGEAVDDPKGRDFLGSR